MDIKQFVPRFSDIMQIKKKNAEMISNIAQNYAPKHSMYTPYCCTNTYSLKIL